MRTAIHRNGEPPMIPELQYVSATEKEFDVLLAGEPLPQLITYGRLVPHLINGDRIAVIVSSDAAPDGLFPVMRPLAIIADQERFQRLFGRYATLRSELSPLSAWCHVFRPEFMDAVQGPSVRP